MIGFHGFFLEDSWRVLMLELADTNLHQEIYSIGPFSAQRATRLLEQVATGLHHVHELGIVHMDLKPANILLASGVAKLADFGLARDGFGLLAGPVLPPGGTVPYSAPEVLDGREFGAKADLWSLGCTMFEALTGDMAFPGALEDILTAQLQPPALPPQLLSQIISSMLQYEECRRPSPLAIQGDCQILVAQQEDEERRRAAAPAAHEQAPTHPQELDSVKMPEPGQPRPVVGIGAVFGQAAPAARICYVVRHPPRRVITNRPRCVVTRPPSLVVTRPPSLVVTRPPSLMLTPPRYLVVARPLVHSRPQHLVVLPPLFRSFAPQHRP